jgi:tyrosine-specific transport protein
MRWAIIIGTSIPFIVYSLWQWMIIGTIPLDQLQSADNQGMSVSEMLFQVTGHPWIASLGLFFGFFALVTSLLGVSLSMIDFLGDGLSLPRTGGSRWFLLGLVFLPPAIFAVIYPHIFITAIGIAGGFGEAILNGLLPVLMVWVGHHVMKLPVTATWLSNKAVLVALILFTFLIIGIEIVQLAS